MLFDVSLPPIDLRSVPEIARAADRLGFDCLWSSETMHDPFLSAALIAEHTHQIHFGTSIAVAFARSPATLAYTAWDLAQASNGRFILGLGTQVKPHIEKRFGMPWPDSVVGKLREQIGALRAFWHTWQTGEPLNFRGEYYKLTLMTPFFNPGPIPNPRIPVYIAGEAADGFLVHPFHTSRYLTDVLMPAIVTGLEKAGRKRADISLSTTVFVVTSNEEELLVRAQIGFYASTPSYRAVMALHGWEDTADRLSALVRQGKWGDLPSQLSEEMLETFAIVCTPQALGSKLKERYKGLVDRLGLYLPFIPGERDEFWRCLASEVIE
jgi:probable F420-dependent oxidoreductase